MVKFITKLAKLFSKILYKYLLFILIVSFGCLYHVIQVTLVYLQFETKIDFSINKNDLTIPMISFCRWAHFGFKNKKSLTWGMTPAQVYNQTYTFGDIFLYMRYYYNDKGQKGYLFKSIRNMKKYEQLVNSKYFNSKTMIHIEKTFNHFTLCYNFKHFQNKFFKPKWEFAERTIFEFYLYTHKLDVGPPYGLILSRNNDYNIIEYNQYSILRNIF